MINSAAEEHLGKRDLQKYLISHYTSFPVENLLICKFKVKVLNNWRRQY